MWHHFLTFFYMLAWMTGPIAIYALAPRKRRDPFVWVALATLLGPPVPAVFFALKPVPVEA